MNCDTENQLIDYLLNTLSQDDRGILETHLTNCLTCQQKLERIKKAWTLLEKWEPDISRSKLTQIRHTVMENIQAQKLIEEKRTGPRKTETVRPKSVPVSRVKTIFNYKITAFASAAIIMISIVLGVNFINKSSTPRVAWANMIKKIEKIKFYTYQRTTSMVSAYTEVVTEKATVYRSSEYGIRINRSFTYTPGIDFPLLNDNIIEYGSLADHTFITVYPRLGKYTHYLLTKKNVYRLHDFYDIVTYLKMVSSFNYKKLGSKIIDEKEVVGFEIIDPKLGKEWYEHCVARAWIDVDTNLPVLYEYLGMVGDGTKLVRTVLDSFEWYETSDTDMFEPDLSECQLVAEIEVGPINEETALLTLQRFSEIANGRYPTSLARPNALWDLTILYKRKVNPFFLEVEDFQWEEYAFLRAHLETTCMFYGELFKEDKDVAYHGKVVTTDDHNLPLMRWKISDGEYRVIFGDLRIEDVSVDELFVLEANLPQENVFE